jgi:probable rRNA maturation factor
MTTALSFRNRQRARALNSLLLRQIVRHLLYEEFELSEYELCFHFVGEKEMAKVNWKFLQHEGSTDVITFDLAEPGSGTMVGEIYISVPDAVKQAREFGTTWQEELIRYIIHSLLHLQGHDDLEAAKRRVMKREENRLVKKVAAKFSLRNLALRRPS